MAWSVGYQLRVGWVQQLGEGGRLGPQEPKDRCKKQREHISVTEGET